MHMSSHYSPPGARWVFLLATIVYTLAAGLAPAVHFSEDGEEFSAYLALLVASDGTGEAPAPPPPHNPDDLDCLFCQVLTAPAQVADVDLPQVALRPTSPGFELPTDPVATPGRLAPGARAPPAFL